MKTIIFLYFFVTCLLHTHYTYALNAINTDEKFDVNIAVVINNNSNCIGKFEYSNDILQLITFCKIENKIFSEPYIFNKIDQKVIKPNVHEIKFESVNDRYGKGMMFIGTINFTDLLHPIIHFQNTIDGGTYISNITPKGKAMHKKYIPKIWIGY